MEKVGVVGIGKLGACTAACLAYKDFDVLCMDKNSQAVDLINSGKAPVVEPQLQELIDQSEGRIRATSDYEDIVNHSDVTFLIVPTPSLENGHFSDEYLKDCLEGLARVLEKHKKKYHLFSVVSTVSPQTSETILIPLIESVSGRKLNTGFGFCYNPEFIALGSVIRDFLNPDMVLIGESEPRCGDVLENIYRQVCDNTPQVARMSVVSAEITKISLNSYVTMKISFANTLANICEQLPGANVDDITVALGADKRIGRYYLKGGLGYGGPCFPRDNIAFAAFAQQVGIDAYLAKATDQVNDVQIERLRDVIVAYCKKYDYKQVGLLGLAYKTHTPVVTESTAMKLIPLLLENELEVFLHDPLATEATKAVWGDKVHYCGDMASCCQACGVLVILSAYEEYQNISQSILTSQQTVIIDCWRILNQASLGDHIDYVGLGLHA
jgi:UDPglucose 6-dehydrogenase